MADNETKSCPRDCRQCTFQQHAFCSAQIAFNSLGMLQELERKVETLSSELAELRHSEPVGFLTPLASGIDLKTAQEGSGAQE